MQKGNLPNWNAIANQTKNKEGERKKNIQKVQNCQMQTNKQNNKWVIIKHVCHVETTIIIIFYEP